MKQFALCVYGILYCIGQMACDCLTTAWLTDNICSIVFLQELRDVLIREFGDESKDMFTVLIQNGKSDAEMIHEAMEVT